jgi:hypothetical protein
VVRVGDVYDMLMANKHNGFPVVGPAGAVNAGEANAAGAAAASAGGAAEADGDGRAEETRDKGADVFKGMILRRHLTTLLTRRDFLQQRPLPFSRPPQRCLTAVAVAAAEAARAADDSDPMGSIGIGGGHKKSPSKSFLTPLLGDDSGGRGGGHRRVGSSLNGADSRGSLSGTAGGDFRGSLSTSIDGGGSLAGTTAGTGLGGSLNVGSPPPRKNTRRLSARDLRASDKSGGAGAGANQQPLSYVDILCVREPLESR